MFCKICGQSSFKNVVIVTNVWEDGSRAVNDRDRELRTFFKLALDEGAQMVRHDNTVKSAHSIIRRFVKKSPTALLIERELVDKQKDIVDTAAGKAVNQELNEQIKQHKAKLIRVQKEIGRALMGKEEATRRELEEKKRSLHERMADIAKDEMGMSVDYLAETQRVEARVEEMKQGSQKRQRDEPSHTRSPRDETNVSLGGPQDPASVSTTILTNDLSLHGTSPRPRETGWTNTRHRTFSSATDIPSPQMSSITPYVQVMSHFATHDS